MSEYYTKIVRLPEAPLKHPNADALEIWEVMGGYPCIARLGEFRGGQLVGYISVDAIMPDKPEWAFLGSRRRIRAKKLRGVFSMGLLTAAGVTAESKEGDDIGAALGIVKYDPDPENAPSRPGGSLGKNLSAEAPRLARPLSKYDIEGLRNKKYAHVIGRWISENTEVVLTEKLHGTSGRCVYTPTQDEPTEANPYPGFHVGSRNLWVKYAENSCYWRSILHADMYELCRGNPGLVYYGEVVGVQDLKYGATNANPRFYVFDVYNSNTGTWWGYDDIKEFVTAWAKFCDVPTKLVPELYRGPWRDDLKIMAEGKSTLADHVREGFVVKPVVENWDGTLGREILKFVGEGYLTR